MTLIERIKNHSVEVGDCWEWTGYCCNATPTIRYKHDGQWVSMGVRRAILVDRGVVMTRRFVAANTCNNPACVNPDHVARITRVTHTRTVMGEYNSLSNPNGLARAAKIAKVRRAGSKLTMEQVRAIRAHVGAAHKVAASYNISTKHFNEIRKGIAWRDHVSPFSGLFR
jgi:hypothetical protein